MTRRLFLMLALLFCAMPCVAAPVTVRDARGVSVTLSAPPRRIVSLSPGTTEMLFALGLGTSVVGDTNYCNYPPAAKKIAKIGDVTTSDERVLALAPDLIVADKVANRAAVARLGGRGKTLFAVGPITFTGVEQSLRDLGRLTGTARQANSVVAGMERKRRAAAALAARDGKRPKTLIVLGTNPLFVAGRGTFLDDIVTRAGGVNLGANGAGYGPMSPEKVLADPPDIILGDARVRAALQSDPALRTLAAVRTNKFFTVSNPDILLRPGPRLADGLLEVARALHP